MADSNLSRQQLYDRIRESSKDAVVLEEMKRMGFWKKDARASAPELIIHKEADLTRELNKLMQQKRNFQNKEVVLKEMRLKRMAEAKQKREVVKKKRELQRLEKAEAWKKRSATEILYLGEGVSVGLNHADNKTADLQKHQLPVFANEVELAAAMGLTLPELSFLSFSRKVSTVSHYRKFYLPKKSGGKRLISAPMPRLKAAQYWILENILNKVPVHQAVHGFKLDRSIVTNAQGHVGKAVVINIDVKDFFPSVHYKRVKGLLQQLGYSEKIATILSLLCTEAVTEEAAIDGRNYFIQKGNRVLPQGAPTSPAITNILCYKLDKRMQGLAAKHACHYTRYADDITFSFNDEGVSAQQLVWRMKKVLADEGFAVHPDKIRIMRKGDRQEVTGIVVNRQMNVNRKKLRQFRALLHQLKTADPATLQWGHGSLASAVAGYANFVKMVNPVKGAAFQQKVNALFQEQKLQYAVPGAIVQPKAKTLSSNQSGASIQSGSAPHTPNNDTPSSGNKNSDNKDDDKPWYNVV